MITLYHGSNMAFSVPDLSAGRQGMDFGKGLYREGPVFLYGMLCEER